MPRVLAVLAVLMAVFAAQAWVAKDSVSLFGAGLAILLGLGLGGLALASGPRPTPVRVRARPSKPRSGR